MPKLIAITGGIGSGKSVVCRILRAMGYEVFDCDSRAKALMDADEGIKERLAAEIAAETVTEGKIDRAKLSAIVFADKAKLQILNNIVHSAVRENLKQWQAQHNADVCFVETAILFESGLNRLVDGEWRVMSPLELRVERTMKRSNMSRQQVEARISAQQYTPSPDEPQPALTIITNDEKSPLLPQIFYKIAEENNKF